MISKLKIFVLLIGVMIGLMWFTGFKSLIPGYHLFYYTPTKYQQELGEINNLRKSANQLDLKQKQKLFEGILVNKIFPFWYGTFWSFYGHTQVPGQGSIACGYFVTTTLTHAGIKLNRTKLAQCASEQMIKTIVQKKYINYYNNLPINEFVTKIKQNGKGLYLIGLDNHTGFIFINNLNQVRFIHSSGRFPFAVINEDAEKSVVLQKSVYKVVGKISEDEILLSNWTK
jgi:hypothetical protein